MDSKAWLSNPFTCVSYDKYQRHVNFTQSKWILEEQFYHKTVNTDYIYDPFEAGVLDISPGELLTDITNYIPTRQV